MACPVQPREDIPFTSPSRSIPQRTLISHFAANRHPCSNSCSSHKSIATSIRTVLSYFASTTLYPPISSYQSQVASPSYKPIQREIALFSTNFDKPPVLFKSPLLAKSSLNLYELYYISFCSHRSDHSGLWRRHSPVGPSHEIVISAFSAGYQPHTNFRSPQKIIVTAYTNRNAFFGSTLYARQFGHSGL